MTRKKKTIKRTILLSDLQIPYHDARAVKNVISFIRKWKPDRVVSCGDEIDLPQLSRWERGLAGEFAGTLDRDRRIAQELLYDLRVDAIVRSNHTDRLYNSIKTRLPALAALPELQYENWMGLRDLGIKYHRDAMPIAKNWILLHGDEGQVTQKGGQTALGLSERTGLNVACGHTHRAGITHKTQSVGGKVTRTLWGFELGCLMDLKQAGYTRGIANWTQSFGILYEAKKQVTPVLVPIETDGSFMVEGKIYG